MRVSLVRSSEAAQLALVAQFCRFGAVGTLGFFVDSATVYATRGRIGLYGAGTLAFLVAASVTWALNRAWTFRGRSIGAPHRQWALFLAANSVGFLLNRGVYFFLVTVCTLCATNPVIAVGAGSITGMFANFTLSRRLVFR